MGSLKFYRPMQAVWEINMFGSATYTSGTSRGNSAFNSSQSFRYCDATNGLSGYFFSDADLTTASTSNKFPVIAYSNSTSMQWQGAVICNPFLFVQNDAPSAAQSDGYLSGTTNTTHDSTRNNLNNKVASIAIQQKVVNNGTATITISVTNLDTDNAVTVKAIEKVGYTPVATSVNNATQSGSLKYFLAWAYYLDESEWIELEAGETKTATLSITLADLTQ